MILLDTNLLARMTNSKHPQCMVSRRALSVLSGRGEQLVIVPQDLYEFWAVATRPLGQAPQGQNGLDMTISQASQWTQFFQRRFTLLPDRADLVDHRTHGVRGFRCHDARFVAAMQTHGISRLLTFNGADFKQFPITIVDPTSV